MRLQRAVGHGVGRHHRARMRARGSQPSYGRRSAAAGSPCRSWRAGAPSAAAASAINPNGILKYGYDLNNEFANNFDPGTEENDCSYTVFQNIFESVTSPGNTAISPGVAQSWTISNNASTVTLHIRPNMVFSNGDPVTASDVELSLEHTKVSPLRSSLSAIRR